MIYTLIRPKACCIFVFSYINKKVKKTSKITLGNYPVSAKMIHLPLYSIPDIKRIFLAKV